MPRPRSNVVTFDVIYVTEVDTRDLTSTSLPFVLARFFIPRRGKPGDEAILSTMLSILALLEVVSPLAAFGGSMRPWFCTVSDLNVIEA